VKEKSSSNTSLPQFSPMKVLLAEPIPIKDNSKEGPLVNILGQNGQNNGVFSISMTVDSRYTLQNDSKCKFKSLFKMDDINKMIFTQAVKEEIDSHLDPMSPNDRKQSFFRVEANNNMEYMNSKLFSY